MNNKKLTPIKYLLLCLSLLLIISSCSTVINPKSSERFFQEQKPYESIITITNKISYTKCKTNGEGELENCKSVKEKHSSGSGFAITATKDKSNKIGTAGHMCKLSKDSKAQIRLAGLFGGLLIKNIKLTELTVISDLGKEYEAEVINYNKNLDSCLLKINKEFPALKWADEGPTRGKRYYTAGAPLGLTGREMTFLASGLYSGTKEFRGRSHNVYSIPSVGGSSGSAILDKEGNLVGLISLGIRNFEEISISPEYSKTKEWFIKNLKTQRILESL